MLFIEDFCFVFRDGIELYVLDFRSMLELKFVNEEINI